ncbi:riboflavin transporter [Tetragenococcus halophilus subsp. flandriensis]|uniref:ECF transporter S component n=1 Tax=Tetragenococcus halophilus TaxID=51669 RepID=UPI0023E92101|nr:ECF transporter S component [Tetragenococcus halophilus]GMA08143.1 riboflavin transporter [Tetragenococcus halophilus subsp. flandriensis]
MQESRQNTKYIRYITFMAAFSALAYISVIFLKIPMIAFLKYEPKDVFVILGGLIFGPLFTVFLSIIVPFLELITVSSTGIIGFIMNAISTFFYVLPPVLFYAKRRSTKSLLYGLIIGTIGLTIVMIMWNYFLAPIFFGYTREAAVQILVPVILQFNLIKGGINAVLILLLYKPVTNVLVKSNILKKIDFEGFKNERKIITSIVTAMLILTVIFVILSYFNIV